MSRHTHGSRRGLLSCRRSATCFAPSHFAAAAIGFTLDPPDAAVALRVRKAKNGRRWLLLINRALDSVATVTVKPAANTPPCVAREIHPGSSEQPVSPACPLTVGVPPGGGACFELSTNSR